MAKTFDELAGRTMSAAARERAARRTRELLAEATAFVGMCGRCGAAHAAADRLGTRQTACPDCRTGELVWPAAASTDAELDAAYDAVDDLLRAGDWPAAEALMLSRPAAAETTDMLLALLTATAPAKSRLPGRAGFLAAVRSALRARGEDEARLLEGLG
jgi:hypothetical protein